MIKCKFCQGQKTVNGMGNMREKCNDCNGKGFYPDAPPIKVTAEHIAPHEKRKKGSSDD